ncbi:MAG: helix-turn-helix transcriptional regulator [Saprospiraceae bacterium]|nr:helix-turn-helix transcriptional regulator [Saprospiraceae bacterium]MBK6566973.1 helix-turn-helix transcriptional regulator [Saprospiraceae bacterium]MBK6783974.1 helix-turn-helix transcriptional regulator [Saprospiraceae bacterium]MBK7525071.1 helix-turn-helix transcriptional regulator [Saprospiraceae bacterium]MBK8372427.1 helix-turn-helix transcriptional regulator [Saprospiraceae bacterium]
MPQPYNNSHLFQNSEENLPKKFAEGDLDMEIIGKEIKRIRRIKKISQTQLGVLIGVERSQIAKIENAKKDTRISTVVRVFKALEVRVKFVLESRDPELK